MKKGTIIGIDVGGTSVKAGLVSDNQVVAFSKKAIRAQGKYLIEDIVDVTKKLKTPLVKKIGVALPGNIDPHKGVLHYCHNLPRARRHLAVAKILQQRLGLPTFIEHDPNCFVLAETIIGQGKVYPIVAGITLGTGIGFALTINKKIYPGSQNLVEAGHIIVQKDGEKCKCGGFGHFESYVSGNAMIYLYKKRTGQKKDTYEIVAAAKKGERAASLLLKTMSDYLAIGLANIIYAYDPHIIVIGGGLSTVAPIINPARQKVKKLLLYPEQLKTKIVKSKTPYHSNILGAALITNRKKYAS
ncbi:MAG: ROK family protein [Patescibacteria group bacterium]